MNKLGQTFQLIRGNNLLIALLVIVETSYLVLSSINALSCICIILILSFMSSGYIINDILDVSIDRINKKNRPLVHQTLTLHYCQFLNIICILLGVFLSFHINHKAQIVLYIILLPLLIIYNLFAKKMPLIGNLIISFLLGMVFVFTEIILNNTYAHMIGVGFFASGLTLIREILKDLCDVEGDKSSSMKTLPIVFGKKMTLLFVQALIFGFIILTTCHILYYYESSKYYFSLFIILVEIPLLFLLFLLVRFPTKNTILLVTRFLKIIMLCGTIVIFFMKGVVINV